MRTTQISIVVPLCNEEGNIAELYSRLNEELGKTSYPDYEIIFVDDGSSDRSWDIISELSRKDDRVRGFRFSKNFGHQYALKAGLDLSHGEAVISMDADLQHPPEMIHTFLKEWKNGYHIVQALHKKTEDVGFFKELTSRLYYFILNAISDFEIMPGASDFRLMDRAVVDEIKEMNESYLFIRSIVSWIGFNKIHVEYQASKRFSGETKYSLNKMARFAIDGIVSFCIKPLRIAIFFGCTISLLAFIYILYAMIAHFILKITLPGWTSLLISILFIGGIQLISIGILGEYLGRLFIQSKNRKNYIISDRVGE
jgi:glycosyltransferase involved in cell wall biosynthesis